MALKYDAANVLECEAKTTIADWCALVEAEPELEVIPLSRGDGYMRSPEMYHDLVSCLRNPLPLGTHALSSTAAREHASGEEFMTIACRECFRTFPQPVNGIVSLTPDTSCVCCGKLDA